MVRKLYTPADHQRAFEIWYDNQNISRTAQVIGCQVTTIRDWMSDAFKCTYNCPWHGYKRLEAERKAALQAKFALLEQGNVDPVSHHKAIAEAVAKASADGDSNTRRQIAVETIVRSDLERISHLELLYAKVFHQATGLAIDHGAILGLPEGPDRYLALEGLLKSMPLKATSLESAIKTLIVLTDQIKKLQEDLGIKRKKAAEQMTVEQIEEIAEPENGKELSIEELRKFRGMLEHTPAENIDILKKAMKADDEQVRLVLGEQSVEPISVPVPAPPPPPPELVPAS